MSGGCCGNNAKFDGASDGFKRALWLVIVINAVMFAVEMYGGAMAGSQALKADALDFLADSATYGLSLWAIGRSLLMSIIGLMALVANVISVLILVRYKDGDANVRSVWLCSRNDAVSNIAVIIAAGVVWYTQSAWPDLIVAIFMAGLFTSSAIQILKQAWAERKETPHCHTT